METLQGWLRPCTVLAHYACAVAVLLLLLLLCQPKGAALQKESGQYQLARALRGGKVSLSPGCWG
jgi:hypothetical protein